MPLPDPRDPREQRHRARQARRDFDGLGGSCEISRVTGFATWGAGQIELVS